MNANGGGDTRAGHRPQDHAGSGATQGYNLPRASGLRGLPRAPDEASRLHDDKPEPLVCGACREPGWGGERTSRAKGALVSGASYPGLLARADLRKTQTRFKGQVFVQCIQRRQQTTCTERRSLREVDDVLASSPASPRGAQRLRARRGETTRMIDSGRCTARSPAGSCT